MWQSCILPLNNILKISVLWILSHRAPIASPDLHVISLAFGCASFFRYFIVRCVPRSLPLPFHPPVHIPCTLAFVALSFPSASTTTSVVVVVVVEDGFSFSYHSSHMMMLQNSHIISRYPVHHPVCSRVPIFRSLATSLSRKITASKFLTQVCTPKA